MPERYRALIVAIIAGALLPLAFAPFRLFPLAILSPAVLFYLWQSSGRRQSALLGFAYGLAAFGVGVSWVYVTMHVFGNMAPALAALATFLFTSYLAGFYALIGYVQARFSSRSLFLRYVVMLPAVWVLMEWARGWLLTGFPWLDLGYSQLLTPLGNVAPWLGVYGVSYFVALTAGLLVWAWLARRHRIGVGIALLCLWGIPMLLSNWSSTYPVDKPIQVALVQGDIPLKEKWAPQKREQIINKYLELSRTARDAQLVVWPEGAVPAYLQYVDKQFIQQLQKEASLFNTEFLFGVLEVDELGNGTYYNSVARVGAANTPIVTYRKAHLVPFGEYPPLDPLFRWLMQSMHIPMANFSPGSRKQGPITVAGEPAAISICYENLFGQQLAHMFPRARFLVNVSENAWYGDSFAPHQLVEMAQMRSLEFGRPSIRVDNSGPSVVIDANGRIRARTEQFVTTVLTAAIQPRAGATPYVQWGDSPIVGWLVLVMFAAWRLRRQFPG
ncbi:MAG: apolipoprotein N-acyltransferase [Acidiferrobacterales bacterium]